MADPRSHTRCHSGTVAHCAGLRGAGRAFLPGRGVRATAARLRSQDQVQHQEETVTMSREQDLRCRECGQTAAETKTPASPQAVAFTCSKCLMRPQERGISPRQGGSSGRPSRAPKEDNDSGAFRGMLRNVGGRPRKATGDRFARSRDRRLGKLTPAARQARRRKEVERVTTARATRRAVEVVASV